MRHSNLLRRLFSLVALLIPLAAEAGSFSLSEQSVSGLGTAYAGGAAQAEDASTLFFNPAGIVLLNQGELQLAAHVVIPSATFNNQGSRYVLPGTRFDGLPVTGGNGGDAGVTHLLPNFYLTQPVFRNTRYGDLSVGVGFSVPFGLETDYEPGWVGRYQALRTKLTTFDIEPTVAYRFLDRISLGAGLDIQRASARLTQAIDFGLAAQPLLGQFYAGLPAALAAQMVPPALIGPTIAATQQAYAKAGFVPGGLDGVSEVAGDDWNVGFSLGAMLEYRKGNDDSFFQEGRIGVSYRSAIDHTLEGRAEFRGVPAISAPGAPVQFPVPGALQGVFFDQNASARLDLPDILHLSIYQRFAHKVAIMGDIGWTHWSRLQSVPIVFQNPGTPTNVLEINYDDAFRFSTGLEWYATQKLTLRLGFAYDETPIKGPEFRTPRIPDNDRYFLSAGLKWSVTNFMDFDLGYAHLFVDQPDTELVDSQGHLLRGNYDASVDIVSASLTFRWGGPRGIAPTSSKEVSGYRK
ncbi:MAG: OmpP1/FadL family transporter [Chthoniobacterales bacterium]